MTYLEIVNSVLRRLREDEVSSVSSTTYSKMIGDFVNDAKEMVEKAWDWSALRRVLTITTFKDVHNYTLTGAGNELKILTAYNDTNNWKLKYRPIPWFEERYLLAEPISGAPQYFTENGVSQAGDTQIEVYPKPHEDGTVLKFNAVVRGELVDSTSTMPQMLRDDGDRLAVPSSPVLHLAVALSSRERGETGGTSTAEYFAIADKSLSDAVALDAQKHPEETIWYTS